MKYQFLLFLISVLLSTEGFSQSLTPPEEGKSVVYFVRPSGLGAGINFQVYDGEAFIGKFNGVNYMRYECAPGQHVFWSKAENRSFVNASLAKDRMYIIEMVPQMGAIKAKVKLIPIRKNDKRLKKIYKLLETKSPRSFDEKELQAQQQELQEIIVKGLGKYKILNGKRSLAIGELLSEDYHEYDQATP